jgi:hypothetical protein
VSTLDRLRDMLVQGGVRQPIRVLAASGQLGYGIPDAAFEAGLARSPHVIGADMGSIDPGPAYLGSGQMGTSPQITREDLAKVLVAARRLNVPLIIGSAGTAGAKPHLDATLSIVRNIARERGLHFRLGWIHADMPRAAVKAAVRERRVTPIGKIPDLTEQDVDQAAHLVGQMGCEAFQRALHLGAEVVIAGRACDTAVYASIPAALGYPMGPTMHMSKIIECCSLCCNPGGRDALLGTLDGESFVLDSMNPVRHATPMSVAAHSLYEQSDPYVVHEPEGALHVDEARYEAIDEHRTRVWGARWVPAERYTVKIEGSVRVGERAILLAGSADPRVIAGIRDILAGVEKTVRELAPPSPADPYRLYYRVYGIDGVFDWGQAPDPLPREIFVMVECIAASAAEAKAVATVFKQYMLHHGFPGRLSTGGNLAFPFTPPEVSAGTAYRFNAYHIMQVDALEPLFPVETEDL